MMGHEPAKKRITPLHLSPLSHPQLSEPQSRVSTRSDFPRPSRMGTSPDNFIIRGAYYLVWHDLQWVPQARSRGPRDCEYPLMYTNEHMPKLKNMYV